jgi:hypothetical protein
MADPVREKILRDAGISPLQEAVIYAAQTTKKGKPLGNTAMIESVLRSDEILLKEDRIFLADHLAGKITRGKGRRPIKLFSRSWYIRAIAAEVKEHHTLAKNLAGKTKRMEDILDLVLLFKKGCQGKDFTKNRAEILTEIRGRGPRKERSKK